jgi:acyl-CoA reductase-like NAD-dependent aldehyde dehydrogenase
MQQMSMASLNNFIGGRSCPSHGTATLAVTTPFSGKAIYGMPAGDVRDVGAAVAAAAEAFQDRRWDGLAPSLRKRILLRWADLIEAQAGALDDLDAEDMGKPVSVSAFNARSAASLLRFNAESIDKVFGQTLPSAQRSLVLQRWAPRGVVAAITPWNFPTYNAVLKVAPALAAGNTVVLKPSELSPRSALELARLAIEAELPAGALNIVLGKGEIVGKALSLHHGVNMMSFTGSTEVGKLVLGYAAQSNMKPVLAECGGKSPHVVTDDGVDLDAVAAMVSASITTNQGQWCSVGSRLIVAESIVDRLVEKVVRGFERLVPGDPQNSRTTFGPLASARQCERVVSYIEDARRNGARVISGGPALSESAGCFVAPTVVIAASADDPICQNEVFGPVLSVLTFSDLDEAIRLANSTAFGLLAYVWTSDIATGMKLSEGIRSSVLLNAALPSSEGPGHGFSSEPVGESGMGMEGGVEGLKSYLRRQTVWVNF